MPVSAIRYSQDFILSIFDDKRSLADTVNQIVSGKISAQNAPRLIVWFYGDHLFTQHNRWLWCFQKAGVEKLIVSLVCPRKFSRCGKKWMTFEYTENYSRYADPSFVPAIRQVSSVEPPQKNHRRRSRNWVQPNEDCRGSDECLKTDGRDQPPPPSNRPQSRPPITCTRLETPITTRTTKGSSTAVHAEDVCSAPEESPQVVPSARNIIRLGSPIAAK